MAPNFDPDTGEVHPDTPEAIDNDPLALREEGDEDFSPVPTEEPDPFDDAETDDLAADYDGSDEGNDDDGGEDPEGDAPLAPEAYFPDEGDITSDDGGDDEAGAGDEAPVLNVFSIDTLYGDTRDALINRFRNTRKPWEQMAEDEQRDIVESFSTAARNIIRGVVSAMTSYEFPRAVVTLGQVSIKDKKTIEAKITCMNIEEYRTVLGEAVGEDIILMAVDSETFMAHREAYPTKGQQMAMDI